MLYIPAALKTDLILTIITKAAAAMQLLFHYRKRKKRYALKDGIPLTINY